MTRDWVRLTVTDIGSLSGVFLAACRHLLANHEQQQQYYKQLAIHYKVLCVRTLREAISLETSSLISDSTVAINILLAYDEVGFYQGFFSHQTANFFLKSTGAGWWSLYAQAPFARLSSDGGA